MDRDKRWDRTKLAWDAIVWGKGEGSHSGVEAAVRKRYEAGETDEFLHPLIFYLPEQQPVRDGDALFFFNFRPARARQLSRAFLFPDFAEFDREHSSKCITCR